MMRIGNNFQGMMQYFLRMNGSKMDFNKVFSQSALSARVRGYYCGNTIEDLRSGHFKNSYGVEGMCVTGRSDYKKIIPVSDEMKNHVLEDVKMAYYKYNGMSGDNEAEWDAYYRKNNEYYKTLKKEERLSAAWTLGQLHLGISGKVSSVIKAKVPGWTAGNYIPEGLLDEIFADESITSMVTGKAGGTGGLDIKA